MYNVLHNLNFYNKLNTIIIMIIMIESKLHSDEKYKEYNIVHWYKDQRLYQQL